MQTVNGAFPAKYLKALCQRSPEIFQPQEKLTLPVVQAGYFLEGGGQEVK